MISLYELLFLLCVLVIVIFGMVSQLSDERTINANLRLFAEQNHLTFIAGGPRNLPHVTGIYRQRSLSLTAKPNQGRGYPAYTELIIKMENAKNISFRGESPGALFIGDLIKKGLNEPISLRSGDQNFDAMYTFSGSPQASIVALLNSKQVRQSVQALQPPPPQTTSYANLYFQVDKDVFVIRYSLTFSTSERLKKFIDSVYNLVALVEQEIVC